MAGVRISNVGKSFGDTSVLRDISLDIADGEFLTLLGPSGCGKSTLLRIIAGLEAHDQGSIAIGESRVDGIKPKLRDVAMVFQSYALYPHMTVAQNMAVPLRMRRLNGLQRMPLFGRFAPGSRRLNERIERDVEQVAKSIGIDRFLGRKPGQLSGGQRQRVAVGRALVRQPAVFLMDEPLSNLDAKLRVQMRAEIKELHNRLGVTIIYVTHDQSEAMTLSDTVGVMLDGELMQVAPPRDIYGNPANAQVAEFVGSPKINMLDGVVLDAGAVELAGATLSIETGLDAGARVTVGVRPEAFSFANPDTPNCIVGAVRLVEHMGSDLFAHLDVLGASEPVIARLMAERSGQIHTGQTVYLTVNPQRALLFNDKGNRICPDGKRSDQLVAFPHTGAIR